MIRTDDEFIKEVYERRGSYLKKIKKRNFVISLLVPVLLIGAFALPAMFPAASADKSAPLASTVTDPHAAQNTTYPPGTIIITVKPEGEKDEYRLESNEVIDFIQKNVWSKSSQSSSAIHDESADDKRTEPKEKICTFSFTLFNQSQEKYSYTLYENALYDEPSGNMTLISEEDANLLRSLLKMN